MVGEEPGWDRLPLGAPPQSLADSLQLEELSCIVPSSRELGRVGRDVSLSFGRESKALERMQFLRYYHECSCLHPLKQSKIDVPLHINKTCKLLIFKYIHHKLDVVAGSELWVVQARPQRAAVVEERPVDCSRKWSSLLVQQSTAARPG